MDLIPPVGYVLCGAEHLQLPLQQRKVASARHPELAQRRGRAALPVLGSLWHRNFQSVVTVYQSRLLIRLH